MGFGVWHNSSTVFQASLEGGPVQVEKLIAATKGSRNEARDRCLLLLMFRHGLRVSEACGLQLSQVDIESHILHVARLKKGLSTTHPLRPDEIGVWQADDEILDALREDFLDVEGY